MEIHKKEANINGFRRGILKDDTLPLGNHEILETWVEESVVGLNDVYKEREYLVNEFNNENRDLEYCAICFDRFEIPMAASSVYTIEYDLNGNQLFDLDDLTAEAPIISLNLVRHSNKSVLYIIWRKKFREYTTKFIEPIIDGVRTGSNVVSQILMICENVYFKQSWINSLTKVKRNEILDVYRMSFFGYKRNKIDWISSSYPKIYTNAK